MDSIEMTAYRVTFWVHMRINDMSKFMMGLIIKLLPKEAKEMIQKILKVLEGKKTYLFLVGIVIQALLDYMADQDLAKLITTIVLALGGTGARSVAKPQ